MAILLIAGLLATAPAANAADWGYKQISPPDSSSVGVYGIEASGDMSMVVARTRLVPIPGYRSDGRGMVFTYGMPRVGAPWDVGPVDAKNGSQLFVYVRGVAHDGKSVLYEVNLRSLSGLGAYRMDDQGGAVNMTTGLPSGTIFATPDLKAVVIRNSGLPSTPIYLGANGAPPVQASLRNDGTPMNSSSLGGSTTTDKTLMDNSLAADGSSVIYGSVEADVGDNDGGARDIYRRIVAPGAEQTILVSDVNGPGDPDESFDAEYRWATKYHEHIFFKTQEKLEPGDTDNQYDVYVRLDEGDLIRISQGELVDGLPSGNSSAGSTVAAEWVRSSEDGKRTYFTSGERLTQDAPEGGVKIYERDLDEERTRYVAGPLDATQLTATGPRPLSFRQVRVTPQGIVFVTPTALAGAPDDGTLKVYAWTRDDGLFHVDKTDADAPPSPSAAAQLRALNVSGETAATSEIQPTAGGRIVSADGERVFFNTRESLVAEDRDGGYEDVYMWSKDEGLSLVSPPGRAPYDAGYLDSSPDGTQVYFNTSENVLTSDNDPNAADVYLAILGGGSPPNPPPPDADPEVCSGDACQGDVIDSPARPGVGSGSLTGDGNVLDVSRPNRPALRVKQNKAVKGPVTRLRINVPAAGRVMVNGRAVRRSAVSATKAGAYTLRVRLKPRMSLRLRRRNRLAVAVRVAYRARGGGSTVRRVKVTFMSVDVRPARSKQGSR